MLHAVQHGKGQICFKEAVFNVFRAQKIFPSKHVSADGSMAAVFQTKQLQNLAQLNHIVVLYICICVYIHTHMYIHTRMRAHTFM